MEEQTLKFGDPCPDCGTPVVGYCAACGCNMCGLAHGRLRYPSGFVTVCLECGERIASGLEAPFILLPRGRQQ